MKQKHIEELVALNDQYLRIGGAEQSPQLDSFIAHALVEHDRVKIKPAPAVIKLARAKIAEGTRYSSISFSLADLFETCPAFERAKKEWKQRQLVRKARLEAYTKAAEPLIQSARFDEDADPSAIAQQLTTAARKERTEHKDNNMNKKIIVIHHSADFDGLFCREIARKFLGDSAEYIGWDFPDQPLAIPDAETIYVMDLPVDRVFGGAFHASGKDGVYLGDDVTNRIIWIDHHKSSIETHPAWLAGYRIDGVAACRLAWQWFDYHAKFGVPDVETQLPFKQAFIDRTVSEPYAVQLAGEYDIWDKRNPDAEVFQFGLRSMELKPLTWELLLVPELVNERNEKDIGTITVEALLDNGRLLQRYQQGVDASVVNYRSFLVKFEGLTFLALNTARCNSLTFAAKDVPETGHDALMGFYFSGQNVRFSLYHAKHRTELDLSEIAKRYGGGGHRGACGFALDDCHFDEMGRLIPIPMVSKEQPSTFETDIRDTINRHSKENGSNTPDFILACYLIDALNAFNKAVKHRAYWHGHETQPSPPPAMTMRERLGIPA